MVGKVLETSGTVEAESVNQEGQDLEHCHIIYGSPGTEKYCIVSRSVWNGEADAVGNGREGQVQNR